MKSDWIDINDQAPEIGERVIAATKNGYVGECYVNENGNLYRYDGRALFKRLFGEIIAWMSLPKHPNGKRKVFENDDYI